MICRLCLLECEQYKNIFGPEGYELKISSIITKLLFIEIGTSDQVSTIICESCWLHLNNFHLFYCRIEAVQKKLSETFFIKEEGPTLDNNEGRESPNGHLQIEDCNLESYKNDVKELNSNEIKTETHNVNINLDSSGSNKIEETANDNSEFNKNIERKSGRPKNTISNENKNKSHKKRGRPKKLRPVQQNEDIILENRLRRKLRVSNNNCKKSEQHTDLLSEQKEIGNKNQKNKITTKPSEYVKRCKETDDNIAKFMKMRCELCSAECSTFSKIREHYRKVHKRLGYITCCNKKFFRPGYLWEHIKTHMNPDYIRCELCDKTFADGKCLKRHNLGKHTPDDRKIFKCNKCPKSFARQFMLEKHQLIHIPQEERKFFCEPCGKAFPSKTWLQSHIKLVHENAYGIMCHICGKVCQGKSMLEKHQMEHAGITAPKVQCEKCGAWLKTKYGLKKHMKRHANREEDLASQKKFICKICGKVSTTRAGLNGHIQYKHNLKPKHQCNICYKLFKRPLTLKEHMTTHTGEMLYTCPHCPKTFNSNANMHSHRKKKHREEWEANRKNKEKLRELFKKQSEHNSANNVEQFSNESVCKSKEIFRGNNLENQEKS